ncbi:MAG: TfoX/Sxy family protein [Clostridiales bacterium]|nr:TfoX/Sxy family protein [Clostridiales bacterium]
MATSKEYMEYILDQLTELDGITSKPMMGEYLLYLDGVLFGGVYDNRFLIKKTKTNENYNLPDAIPYEGAKAMYMVEDTDERESLAGIIRDTCAGLKK